MDAKIKELESKIDALASYNKSNLESIFEILSSFNKHFNKIEKELEIINTKIDNLNGDTSTNFHSVDSKLNHLGEEIGKTSTVNGFEEIFKKMKSLN